MDNGNQPIDIVDVIESYGIQVVHAHGAEYRAICPFHSDHKRSLTINRDKQIWKCFVDSNGGDAYHFKQLMGDKPEILEKVKKRNDFHFNQISPVPLATMSESPSFRHSRLGDPDKVYPYYNINGELLGYTCRFNTEDGKEILPLCYGEKGGRERWMFQGFKEPRPLYNAQYLDRDKILIVEGEKAADYAQERLNNIAVVSWIGGAKAIHKTDWSVIKDKQVFLWPDNDQSGNEAMQEIFLKLYDNNKVMWVKNPEWAPEHWDVADSKWSELDLRTYLNNNII